MQRFVRSLGCYDDVKLYEELPTLNAAVPSVYVDFAGNAGLRRAVHEHFAEAAGLQLLGGRHALGRAGRARRQCRPARPAADLVFCAGPGEETQRATA